MWSIFEAKCVKVVSFSIIQDFASTDVDALSFGTLSTFNESSKNNFVAVEFDTYKNWWDPSGNHVRITVNSINSSITFSQVNFRPAASALVHYNSTTKNLSVFLTSSVENLDLNWNHILSFKVDLKTVCQNRLMLDYPLLQVSSTCHIQYFLGHSILA